ncbi:hypothetical protein F5Y19DRAFT_401439 [Xylariaceae sp. FL1651]|nr:hypothetical protein F5Y19DRAFT_401439 [Xylariaceae sp. FL1651]
MDADAIEDDVDQQKALIHLPTTKDYRQELIPLPPAGTLLPGPIASAVSFATRSTSFALRIGTAISGYGLDAAKVTTLSSLEIGRGVLEGILSRAGRDVFAGSRSELARGDAESILERSLESLHQTMSQIVFWAATGFHATGTTVSAVSQISQLFLSVLDEFFGSTDSSRAIASIITLIRREFQNPATGVKGEKVGVVDLLLGLCGLAYLQNWCRKMIQEESQSLGYEEVIWDVVVLNDGERVDTLQDGLRDIHDVQPAGSTETNDFLGAIEQHGSRRSSTDDDDGLPEIQLKRQITKSLPKNAKVSISTSTTTSKTITVDIQGASSMSIPSFPGLDLVKSEVSIPHESSPGNQEQQSNYRVVYKVSRTKVRSTPEDVQSEDETQSYVEELDDINDEQSRSHHTLSVQSLDFPPPVPPKSARATIASSAKGRSNLPNESLARQTRSVSDSSSASGGGSTKERSFTNLMVDSNEHAANQKRTRKPLDEPRRSPKDLNLQMPSNNIKSAGKKLDKKSDATSAKGGEKKTGIRGVLKKGHVPTFANFLSRDSSSDNVAGTKPKSNTKPPWGSYKPPQSKPSSTHTRGPVSDRAANFVPNREAPRAPQRGNPNYFSSRDLGSLGNQGQYRGPPRSPLSPVQDRRRNSLASLTDAFSTHSYESRAPSPTLFASDTKASGGASTSKAACNNSPSSRRTHYRMPSQSPSVYTPSIYTLKTRDSQASLVVSSFHAKSAYSDSEALDSLRRSGGVSGMFPDFHFLRNITRYSRYASAVYGSNFLKLMGISKEQPALNITDEMHYDVRSFAHHAKLPPDSIILSSYVDPQGGSDSTGSTNTGIPLVHTVALDEGSKAVVLTCRGTLGFEDILADMMCEYDDLVWRGKTYKVHKGIHASARRLLYGGDGRVMLTIKAALEEYPQYGLVLCGHSLGGAVTALLGAMLAQPSGTSTAFVTSAEQHPRVPNDTDASDSPTHISLPSGRPIHVYAYGPPATMSPSLQKATRGLITSTIHGNDLVPYLSLGVLHDLQALALAFKTDNNEAKAEVRRRIWEGLRSGLADKWYSNAPKHSSEEDDKWAYVALKTLRASMMSSKLLPPGEVFTVESTQVMRRDAFARASIEDLGRPATRIVLKYIRDVETRFREVRFGSSMLMDHSPGRYEDALRRLTLGVVDT